MYWDNEYPTHIEVPEDYWTFSHNVEYSSEENNDNWYLYMIPQKGYINSQMIKLARGDKDGV